MTTYRVTLNLEFDLAGEPQDIGFGSIETLMSTLLCDALAEFNKGRHLYPNSPYLQEEARHYVEGSRSYQDLEGEAKAKKIRQVVARARIAERLRNQVAMANPETMTVTTSSPKDDC